MYAVVMEVDTSGVEDVETALRGLREDVVPRVQAAPGFQSGSWLIPDADGKGFGFVVFDTEENARAAALPVGASPQPGVTVERVAVREIAASA